MLAGCPLNAMLLDDNVLEDPVILDPGKWPSEDKDLAMDADSERYKLGF